MAGYQNKLSRFWQELKRRRVIHVITVYATAAFVIIELVGNLTEPLNLPTSLSTIVIIVLAVGFPLAIILSWLYDLTSGSFERTKPVEDLPEEEKVKVPNAWKIATYVSFVVISGLLVFNIATRSDLIKPGMIQSLVVLPFNNYTGDENLDYVAAGMHASLIGDIGKLSALRVIGETSSNVYKETNKSAPDIAEELNVDIVFEPTLTCYGDTVCILLKAIKPFPEEKQIWVAEYREDKSKIMSLWNSVVKQIADEVKVELTPEEEQLLARSIIVDREAYDDYLKSQPFGDLSPESLLKAREYLSVAIEKDPDWAPLYARMATNWIGMATMGSESPEIAIPKTYENLNKALQLDPDLDEAHYLSAFLAFTTEWNWEKSENEFLKTLAINPNHALARMHYSYILYFLQRQEEGLAQAKLAHRLDPLNPIIQVSYGHILCCEGDCDSALTIFENILTVDPENYYAWDATRIAASQCGDLNRVFEAEKHYMTLEQETWEEIEKIYNEKGFYTAYEEIVRQMEVYSQENYILPIDMALRYYVINEDDKALDWLRKGFELHDPNLPFCAFSLMGFKRLYDNPRFIEIAEKMNLPFPSVN